jgi:hypothetical protein
MAISLYVGQVASLDDFCHVIWVKANNFIEIADNGASAAEKWRNLGEVIIWVVHANDDLLTKLDGQIADAQKGDVRVGLSRRQKMSKEKICGGSL